MTIGVPLNYAPHVIVQWIETSVKETITAGLFISCEGKNVEHLAQRIRDAKALCKQCLDRLKKDPTDFVRQFITTDETWIHQYTPETRQQSKQWVESQWFSAKESKFNLICRKGHGQTITGEYYSNLLHQLDVKIREKRSGLKKKSFTRTTHLLTKRLLAERDSLKETIEELRCDKIQNEPNNMAWESSEMLGILPPPIREQLVRLQHENKMLRLRQEEGGGEQVAVLRSLLDDSERRRNELESENRQANRRLLELEGQLEDLDDMPISHGADLREARAMIDSLESQLQASALRKRNKAVQTVLFDSKLSPQELKKGHDNHGQDKPVEKCFQQQNMLAKKDESMAAMEERYRKYLDKAKNVITSLNTKQHSGMGPAIMTLKNQLAEKDKIIEALEAEVEKTRTLTETEERLITTAFFNLGSQLQRKAAEERLSHSPAPAGQTFLSRQRQASSRRGFNLTEGATSSSPTSVHVVQAMIIMEFAKIRQVLNHSLASVSTKESSPLDTKVPSILHIRLGGDSLGWGHDTQLQRLIPEGQVSSGVMFMLWGRLI
ncbi:HOOK3 [Cordylochernes scorpioides]|uniref:HOOK3 n=1 Tax=Cordylochernes scorpioides TaxID=51811 RepID=A0ABY6KCQ0_9ARAC|nr:HOOK3 [Cordylochernes scorpioides]